MHSRVGTFEERVPDKIAMDVVREDAKDAILKRMESTYNKIVAVNRALQKQGKTEYARVVDVISKIPANNLFRLVGIEAWRDADMVERLKARIGDSFDSRLMEGLDQLDQIRLIKD